MPNSVLCEMLGIRYPVFQGGMAWISDGRLAAAVSEGGGLGIIASGNAPADYVREQIRIAKSLTSRPFGVNVMLLSPYADEVAEVIAQERVAVVTTGAGNPSKYMEMWKAAGSRVIPVVASVALAKLMQRIGASAVIAEGGESGGHVGELTTMVLVPLVADAVSIPVIAAGGIADGRQLAAAFALGACGAQIGTCLLASEECPIHENYKKAVIKASATDTIVTGRTTGAPVRVLKNKMAREYVRMEKDHLPLEELEKLTLGSLRRAVFDGDVDTGSFMAGQVAGMVHEVRPLRQIFEDLMAGYDKTVKEMQG